MTKLAESWWRLVQFGFRLLYNEMAFTYDTVSKVVSLGAWRCWQRTSLKHLPPPTSGIVLEIAHGTGDLQLDLHGAGYTTIGYDLSPYMGQITRRKLHQQGISATLTRGMAQQLPFADESVAAIVSTFPTSFVTERSSLREAYRVLQEGGCYVVVLNGVLTSEGVVANGLEWLYRITGQREETNVDVRPIFGGVGFDVQVVEADCPRSKAQLVILTKREQSSY